MDPLKDKLSIKNLLFSKAIPNYTIPIPTNGYKIYPCKDCGDKFTLESSLQYHNNRKSIKISYMCRQCNQTKIFYNRCNLLTHIRSHSFKTTTINVTDLKVEPLPLEFFNTEALKIAAPQSSSRKVFEPKRKEAKTICFECKNDITDVGVIYKDRAKHYMKYTNEVHACPVCLFALPTICGLKAHLRLHFKCPPYYCPECGVFLSNKNAFYPFNHNCEGFKMMRVTTRLKCPIAKCLLLHPNGCIEHMKNKHLKKVFKCPLCYVACFNQKIIRKHLSSHGSAYEVNAVVFYQCEACPGRLVLYNQIDNHLRFHVNNNVYPCWSCGRIFKDVSSLFLHHTDKHELPNIYLDHYNSLMKDLPGTAKEKVYRVIKRCEQCQRSFTYKCSREQIDSLPNECPFECTTNSEAITPLYSNEDAQLTCHMCKKRISQKWDTIKNHYSEHHKQHKCIDIKVVLPKLNIENLMFKTKNNRKSNKITKKRAIRKRRRPLQTNTMKIEKITDQISSVPAVHKDGRISCNKCEYECETKEQLESHVICHRDPCTAYQCMECGQCFVVKPSFSTHLLIEHGISNVNEYISKKQCYNEKALLKCQLNSTNDEPLRENQCRICRDQFDSSSDLEKHFRVHGMAFLMKNNSTKNNSP